MYAIVCLVFLRAISFSENSDTNGYCAQYFTNFTQYFVCSYCNFSLDAEEIIYFCKLHYNNQLKLNQHHVFEFRKSASGLLFAIHLSTSTSEKHFILVRRVHSAAFAADSVRTMLKYDEKKSHSLNLGYVVSPR